MAAEAASLSASEARLEDSDPDWLSQICFSVSGDDVQEDGPADPYAGDIHRPDFPRFVFATAKKEEKEKKEMKENTL
jgi:hypothetical protein